jgi:hypothetical protein
MADMVKTPDHYLSNSVFVQPIYFQRIIADQYGFFFACALKYVFRANDKDGHGEVEGLKKALRYMDFENELVELPKSDLKLLALHNNPLLRGLAELGQDSLSEADINRIKLNFRAAVTQRLKELEKTND